MDENLRTKELGSNLVPKVLSCLSPSRSRGRVGRNPGNEVGREGENGRDFGPLFSHAPLRFVTSHSRVTRVSRSRLLEKRGALGGAEKEVFPAFFTRTHNIFLSFSGKFFWTTDSSLQSSGCKNLNHWAVHGVRNRIITSCLIAQLILAS